MADVNSGFKFTQNQLNEVDMGLSVTTVSDPNRVVITNLNGYLQVSDITYSQLQELVLGGGGIASADNGLTLTSGNVQLGGELIQDTAIAGDFDGSFNIQLEDSDSGMYTLISTRPNRELGYTAMARIDNTNSLVSHFSLTNLMLEAKRDKTGLGARFLTLTDDSAELRITSAGSGFDSKISITPTNGIVVTEGLSNKGARYAGDYSANNTGANYNSLWIAHQGALIQNQTASAQSASFRISGEGLASRFTSNNTSGSADYLLSEPAGSLPRWSFYKNGVESGGNTGSDFRLGMYNDNGTFNDNVLEIKRSNGVFTCTKTGQFQAGGEALKVGTNTGNPDHAYVGFYARSASPTIKTGEIGHAGFAGTTSFVISNLINGGPLGLVTTGAGGNIQCSGDYISIQSSFATGYNSKLGYHASTQYAGLEQVTHLGSYANGSQVLLRTSSGTGTVGVTANNNSIGRLVFSGFNLTNGAYDSASIKGVATETWSSTAGGSKIDIYTTPNGTIAQKLALTIDQDSSVRTWGGGESLKVGTNTGNPDHAYVGFYPRTASPTVQRGAIGYVGTGSTDILIANSLSNGMINMSTLGSSSSVNAYSNRFTLTPGSSPLLNDWSVSIGTGNGGFPTNAVGMSIYGSLDATTGGILIEGTAYKGTSAARTAVLSGNELFAIASRGQTSASSTYQSAAVRFKATENWSSTAGGSKQEFYTTPNGTVTQTLAISIDQDQSLLYKYASKSVDPTATEIPDGCVKVYLNTTSGVMKMWANQAGVLKSTTLA